MIKPKSFKFNKFQKSRISHLYLNNQILSFGQYGLMALEPNRIRNSTILSVQNHIKKLLKPNGLFWLRIFPHFPVTSKPIEVRMGKGKGSIDHWVAFIRSGQIIIEFTCPSYILAKKIEHICNTKLSFKVKLIKK